MVVIGWKTQILIAITAPTDLSSKNTDTNEEKLFYVHCWKHAYATTYATTYAKGLLEFTDHETL